ncbi:MAG TPA: TrkH family potassium uptake protein, partial [Pseudomonadaceae bacterium]|nr:TrkH family potassium uptake protein [Pseudomonadaceae bacterium]
HIHSSLHPQAQISRQYNKRTISDDILVASLAYFFFVIVALVVSSSLLALMGLDPITSFSGSLTTLMNVGPGLGPIIGPTGNFGDLPDAAKYILSINMLLGRLEYLTLVIIFTRAFWKW